MAADLPRPNVEVTSRETDVGHEVDVFIHRDNKGKTYKGMAAPGNRDAAVKDVIEKVLGDHRNAEFIPRG